LLTSISFQARIGNMDGVLVAHHNASRIFGFQYIPLSEMEARLYGSPSRGERVFEKCVLLLEEVMSEIIGCFPNQVRAISFSGLPSLSNDLQSVRCLIETHERKGVMTIWVEPEDHDEETNGSRPIVQLDVLCSNYLGKDAVRGSTAISSDRPCMSLFDTEFSRVLVLTLCSQGLFTGRSLSVR
jgi:Mitochondrial protein Pet127